MPVTAAAIISAGKSMDFRPHDEKDQQCDPDNQAQNHLAA
jgi:hypothetical protein